MKLSDREAAGPIKVDTAAVRAAGDAFRDAANRLANLCSQSMWSAGSIDEVIAAITAYTGSDGGPLAYPQAGAYTAPAHEVWTALFAPQQMLEDAATALWCAAGEYGDAEAQAAMRVSA